MRHELYFYGLFNDHGDEEKKFWVADLEEDLINPKW